MKIIFLLLCVIVQFFTLGSCLDLEVNPPSINRMPEDTTTTLFVTLRFNSSSLLDEHLNASDSVYTITVLPDEDWKLDVINGTLTWTTEDVRNEANKSLSVLGYYWGYVHMSFYLSINNLTEELQPGAPMPFNYTIVVDRKSLMMDTIFLGFITIFLLVINGLMGCQLDWALIWSVLKKPIGPVCGFLSQFLFMPLFSFWVGSALFDDPLQRLGLFTLGCCPGGTGSNFWTLMFHGDISLSITMTFTSTIAAMGMMPFWMYTLGRRLLIENSNVQIPFLNLIMSLLMLTIPVGIGMFIKHRKPDWAKKSKKIVRPLTFGLILFLFTFGIYNSYKVLMMMTKQMLIAGFFVVVGGYCFGAILSALFCRPKTQVIAISIETAFQNGSVAFILLKLSLPTPESDLASVPVLAQLFQMGPPLLIVYFSWMLLRKCGICVPADAIALATVEDLKETGDENKDEEATEDGLLKVLEDLTSSSQSIRMISTNSKTVTDINE